MCGASSFVGDGGRECLGLKWRKVKEEGGPRRVYVFVRGDGRESKSMCGE